MPSNNLECKHVANLKIAKSMSISSEIITAFSESILTAGTRAQYIRRLESLAVLNNLPGDDLWIAIAAHAKSIATLKALHGSQPSTLHGYASAVLSAFKHVPRLKIEFDASFKAWTAFNESAQVPLDAHALSAKPTTRQSEGWVPLEEIVKKRDSLTHGSDARLLLSMYTMIPSRRNDFTNLRIYQHMSTSARLEVKGNYLVLPLAPAGKKRAGVATLTLKEYKTSKKYSEVTEILPPTLVSEIHASLARHPRDYLFVSPRDGEPYGPGREGSFSKWANSLLRRTFRRPLTLTLLRHAYITGMKFDEMTPLEREDIARRMGHSVTTQMRYKFIFRET